MSIRAILTDIEGTITDIHFVHKVLFPYAAEKLPSFLQQHQAEVEIATLIDEVKKLMQKPQMTLAEVAQQFLDWIAEDKKITPLKTLQGYIWQQGYAQNHFKSHIYPDAAQYFHHWHNQGLKLYIYSSGSVAAQKLLVAYSQAGDLSSLFSGYFDTHIGHKQEMQSYEKIATAIACSAEEILFLSDVDAELDAAKMAGMQTYCIVRDTHSGMSQHRKAHSFSEIKGIF